MKHVSILVLKGATLTSLDGTHQLFTRVNDFLQYRKQDEFYQVDLVATSGETILNNGLYNIKATKTIDEKFNTDLVIIPIICGNFPDLNTSNALFAEWVKEQYYNGAEIASLCVGSFFLASTGILDGRSCATHWASQNEFKELFPQVHVLENTIITDENGVYTSGGTYSYLNLLLHIIEKHLGREISILASKMFEIDIERKSQHQFAIFLGQKKHGIKDVLDVQHFIENNIDKKITVDELCKKFTIQRRTFERRFKKSTGNSISTYIQRVKVEAAKQALETRHKTINEIIYDLGYNDINAFRAVFKKFAGLSPAEYRKKYAG